MLFYPKINLRRHRTRHIVQLAVRKLCTHTHLYTIFNLPYRASGSRVWSCVTTQRHNELRLYRQRPQEGGPELREDTLTQIHLHRLKPQERGATRTPDLTSPGETGKESNSLSWIYSTTKMYCTNQLTSTQVGFKQHEIKCSKKSETTPSHDKSKSHLLNGLRYKTVTLSPTSIELTEKGIIQV